MEIESDIRESLNREIDLNFDSDHVKTQFLGRNIPNLSSVIEKYKFMIKNCFKTGTRPSDEKIFELRKQFWDMIIDTLQIMVRRLAIFTSAFDSYVSIDEGDQIVLFKESIFYFASQKVSPFEKLIKKNIDKDLNT